MLHRSSSNTDLLRRFVDNTVVCKNRKGDGRKEERNAVHARHVP